VDKSNSFVVGFGRPIWDGLKVLVGNVVLCTKKAYLGQQPHEHAFPFLSFFDFATMKLRLGGDAIGSVLFKYVKPSVQVKQLCPNLEHGVRIKNCVILWQAKKTISCRELDMVVLC
jgi:hypothetical protein